MTRARGSKVHYVPDNNGRDRSQCGTPGRTTYILAVVTCRICMFSYLAEQAPWARGFMDGLRKGAGGGQLQPVSVPTRLAEEVDRKVKAGGGFLGRTFRQERGSQKAISELLPILPSARGAIEPIVNDGGSPAQPIRVQPGKISEYTGYACKVGDEPTWDGDPTIDPIAPNERSRNRP